MKTKAIIRTMKAHFLFLAALAVLSAACRRDPLPTPSPRLTATVEAPTKGFYDSGGNFCWHHGDALSFWSDWGFFQAGFYEGADGSTDSYFSVDPYSMQNARTLCFFPHIPGQPYDEATRQLTLCLPDQYTTEWSDRMLLPLAGWLTTRNGDFYTSLKHVGGAVLVPVQNLPEGRKNIFLVADKRIAGEFPLDLSKLGTDGCKAVADNKIHDNLDRIRISYVQIGAIQECSFCFPVPTGEYRLGVEVWIDGKPYWSQPIGSHINRIGRGTILRMPAVLVEPPVKSAEP